MTLSYAARATRCASAMYEVLTHPVCPDCGQRVECTVYGDQVEIPECADPADTCYGRHRVDSLTADALAIAAGKREDYIHNG